MTSGSCMLPWFPCLGSHPGRPLAATRASSTPPTPQTTPPLIPPAVCRTRQGQSSTLTSHSGSSTIFFSVLVAVTAPRNCRHAQTQAREAAAQTTTRVCRQSSRWRPWRARVGQEPQKLLCWFLLCYPPHFRWWGLLLRWWCGVGIQHSSRGLLMCCAWLHARQAVAYTHACCQLMHACMAQVCLPWF